MVWGLLFLSDRSERCCQSVSVSSPYNKMPYSFGFRSQPFAYLWGLLNTFLIATNIYVVTIQPPIPLHANTENTGLHCNAALWHPKDCKRRKRAISKSLHNYCPTLLCRDLWTCGLNGCQPASATAVKPVCCCWVSAYSHLLCEDVEPARLSCDRSLFLSEWHLEGHCHYFNALLGLMPCVFFCFVWGFFFSNILFQVLALPQIPQNYILANTNGSTVYMGGITPVCYLLLVLY